MTIDRGTWNGRIRSSEIRRQRKEAAESPRSQSTQYFTPLNSFEYMTREERLADAARAEILHRTRSAPLKQKRSVTATALARMLSCVACRSSVDEAGVTPPPRRLCSGDVELLRFEKTEAQVREVYFPRRFPPENVVLPSSLPISSPRLCPETNEEDYLFLRNLQRLQRMCGTWRCVKLRSDAAAKMEELLDVDRTLRTAPDNSDTMEIRVEGKVLQQSGRLSKLLDVAGNFDVTGQIMLRRDERRGPLFAKTFLTPHGYINKYHWQGPCAGGLIETMEFSEDGKRLTSRLHAYRTDGRKCDLTVYWERMK